MSQSDSSLDDYIPFGLDPAESLAATFCALFRADKYDFGVALVSYSEHHLDEWTTGSNKTPFKKWRICVPPDLFIEYKKQISFGCDDWGNETDRHEGDFHDRAKLVGAEALWRAGLRKIDDLGVHRDVENETAQPCAEIIGLRAEAR